MVGWLVSSGMISHERLISTVASSEDWDARHLAVRQFSCMSTRELGLQYYSEARMGRCDHIGHVTGSANS